MIEKEKIAVMGAGPMGLAVAYQLVKEGKAPVIFEGDDRIGGMAASFDFNGLSIERYYHFHCVSDLAFFEILRELGIEEKLRWVETKMGYFFQDKVHPWGNPFALIKFPGIGLLSKVRYGLHAFLSTRRNNWRPLDSLEATRWIRRWIGDQAYQILWKKLFDYKFYDYADQLSAAWIWSRIRRIGRSRYTIFREKLGYLEGGSETLLMAMRAYIEQNGGLFLLKRPVTKVVIERGGVTGVETVDRFTPFAKVISTIPIPYVAQVIPDLPSELLQKFRSIKNIAVVCVIARLRKPVTENFWLNVNDENMDIPGMVEYTNLRPLKDHIIYVPFYMPGEHPKFQDRDEVFLEKVRNYCIKINPGLTNNDFIALKIHRYRFAQPVCGPGFLNNLPPVEVSVKGLWIADTSYYYPEDRGISESIGFGRNMARMAV